jgi:DNA-directed RNA polymerase specialized sigma24 family protein
MVHLDQTTLLRCLYRASAWPAPSNYGRAEWHEELRAVCRCAAVTAQAEYDESRGVPWNAFLYSRMLSACLTRYRQEWRFAFRHSGDAQLKTTPLAVRHHDPEINHLVSRLPDIDRSLIRGLYWEGRTERELAASLALSQQAINKRKTAILSHLRNFL